MRTEFTREDIKKYDELVKSYIKKEKIDNMTYEEAIHELLKHGIKLRDKIIRNHDFAPQNDNYSLKRQVKANDLAIETLNKGISQEVVFDYDYLGFEKCPRRKYGNLLDSKHTQFEYCPMCGQKLKWD